jgi:serine protease Do
LTANGYILTNNHVVEDAMEGGIKVQLSDTREYNAKLIGTDKLTDLAVVKVDAADLQPANIGNSDEVEVGHIVFAIGSPLGLKSTMTQGIVSALGRPLGIISDGRTENAGYAIENFIQTDAAVNPGNSGGPLVDINGTVVGVNSAIATTNARYQGYSFAIPINLAKKVATDIIKFGKTRRGYIGVQIQTVDAVTAKASGLEKTRGVIVSVVTPKSAGEAAGIEAGDIILSVDGKEVNSSNSLQTTVANYYPGDEVTLKMWRGRRMIEKKVTLKPREEDSAEVVPATDKRKAEPEERTPTVSRVEVEKLGLTIRSLDANARKAYDTDKGVLIENVEPLGPAQERGLNQGDVILGVGNVDGVGEQSIASPDQFEKSMSRLKQGDAVMLRVKGADKRTRFVAIEMPK